MLVKIICLVLSVCSTAIAYHHHGKDDRFMTIVFICLAIMLTMPFILGLVSDLMGGIIFNDGSGKLKEDFSGIQSLIRSAEYPKAINQLEDVINQKPNNISAKFLLQKVYYEHMDNKNKALQIFFDELKKDKLSEDHEDMIQISIDILLEQQRQDDAKTLIKQCLGKVSSGFLQQKLQQRLKHL